MLQDSRQNNNHKILPDLYLGIWSGRLGKAKTPPGTLDYAEHEHTDPARRTNPDWRRSAGKSVEHSQRSPDHVHYRTPVLKRMLALRLEKERLCTEFTHSPRCELMVIAVIWPGWHPLVHGDKQTSCA